MPKRKAGRWKSNWRTQLNAEAESAAKFEDRLDFRREVWIAVVGIPVATGIEALAAWHRAFVEPAWTSLFSGLLMLLALGVGMVAFGYFVVRESSRLWMALASLVFLLMVPGPASLWEGTQEMVLDQRGLTEYCTVFDLEAFESGARGNRETMARHRLSCSEAHIEQVTSFENRHEIGDKVEAVYDPEGMVRPSFDGEVSSSIGRTIGLAMAGMLVSVAIRLLYVRWRVRRSHLRKRERRAAGRGRRTRSDRLFVSSGRLSGSLSDGWVRLLPCLEWCSANSPK
ncbi:hypothetical protein GCM10029992_61440 [Glycomyces albus]